jgi:hypothetical protein
MYTFVAWNDAGGDQGGLTMSYEVEHRAGASAMSTGVLDRGASSSAQKR